MIETITWTGHSVKIIDQTLLPLNLEIKDLKTVEEVWEAIKVLRVRGAPALGIAAALGVVVVSHGFQGQSRADLEAMVRKTCAYLRTSRPTAVNLFWALDGMERILLDHPKASVSETKSLLENHALFLLAEDKRRCRALGEAGADLLEDGDTVLTHCNAGALATADFGTALGVLYAAHQRGMKLKVIADETRPLLQGARLTSWELMKAGIDVTLICDNMAAHLMKAGRIQKVVVGADRIAMNGDTANKIGTYSVAVLAHFHHVPFYVAAPVSTLDPDCPTGQGIPIEERDPSEVTEGFGKRTAPVGVQVFNPAFDVTPSALISGIITEVGVAKAPYEQSLQRCLTLAKTF